MKNKLLFNLFAVLLCLPMYAKDKGIYVELGTPIYNVSTQIGNTLVYSGEGVGNNPSGNGQLTIYVKGKNEYLLDPIDRIFGDFKECWSNDSKAVGTISNGRLSISNKPVFRGEMEFRYHLIDKSNLHAEMLYILKEGAYIDPEGNKKTISPGEGLVITRVIRSYNTELRTGAVTSADNAVNKRIIENDGQKWLLDKEEELTPIDDQYNPVDLTWLHQYPNTKYTGTWRAQDIDQFIQNRNHFVHEYNGIVYDKDGNVMYKVVKGKFIEDEAYTERKKKTQEEAAMKEQNDLKKFVGTWTNTDNSSDGNYKHTCTITVYADGTTSVKCKGYYKTYAIAPLTGTKLTYVYNWTKECPRLPLAERSENRIEPKSDVYGTKNIGTCTINGVQKKSLDMWDILKLDHSDSYNDGLTFSGGVLKDKFGRVFKKAGAGTAKKK